MSSSNNTSSRHSSPNSRGFLAVCSCAVHTVYLLNYATGSLVIRRLHRLSRRFRHLLRPIGYRLRESGRAVKRGFSKRWKKEQRLFAEDRLFLQEYRQKIREQNRGLAAFGMKLKIPFFSLYRHRRIIGQTAALLFPIAASLLLYGTIRFWSNVTFGLSVEYQGEALGYISDETVFSAGVDMASDRIVSTGKDTFQVERTPHLTLSVVNNDELLSDNEVCDKILRTSGDEIAEMSGLYINGNFEGALESRTELDELLTNILSGYLKNNTASVTSRSNLKVLSQNAEFVQDVAVVDGLYPVSTALSQNAMKTKLTANSVVNKYYTVVDGDTPSRIARLNDMTLKELYALNPGMENANIHTGEKICIQRAQPYLRVQVVQKIQYTESIAYKTVEKESNSYRKNYRKVTTTGRAGTQKITAQATLVDGVEESLSVLDTAIVQKPVDQVVTVGTKSVPKVSSSSSGSSYSGPITVSGRFIWPVPSSHLIYSGYGRRGSKFHKGIDIAGHSIYGKNILASDGGRVIQTHQTAGAGYGSYGKFVLIDHGNGFVTMYAHCSAISVKVGDRVSQGQVIGKVGSTGRSTGPHLHFEIRYKGSVVNPTKYVR